MKGDRSLVRRVLINNFRIIIIAIVSVLVLVFILLCGFFRDNKITEAKTQLAQAEQSLQFRVEESIQRTDYIINMKMISSLDREFTDGYELMSFINEFTEFIDAFEETDTAFASEIPNLLIYTSNTTLAESKYIRYVERLTNYQKIAAHTDRAMQIFYWLDEIHADEYGRPYLTLYRRVPMHYECIIEIKVPLEEIIKTNGENPYRLAIVNQAEAQRTSPLFFSAPMLEKFLLTAEVPQAMLYGQYALYLLMLGTLGVVFLAIVYALSTRSVLRTMKDVLTLITQIQSGELLASSEEDLSQWEEVRIIKNKISVMTRQLGDMSRREFENKLLQKKLEIEILNAKINPHLLYNSLSAIKLIAFKEQNTRIDEMVNVLIDYYRLVLNQGMQFITVGKELEYLEKYIKIHEISKKTEYDLEFDVCEEVFDIEIPHLLLQPIVENAIIHGLNTVKEACISIAVRPLGEELVFEIADNGVGIEPEKLAALNRGTDLGYGLTSVVERLRFYYGNQFDLRLASAVGEGTKVILQVSRKIANQIVP